VDSIQLGVVGANGRLGVALIDSASASGLTARPIVRDDRDQALVGERFGASEMYYADPSHEEALVPVLEGLTHVIAAVEPRAAGPGSPIHSAAAGAALVNAARRSGVKRLLFVSVMGAFRWSSHPLCRRAHRLEESLRTADGPWAVARVSAYVDELIEGHIRPPDGGAVRPLDPSGRYSPLSRAEAARLLLRMVQRVEPHRSQAIGGLDTYSTAQLRSLLDRWQPVRRGRQTRYFGLPPGDVSVDPETTRCGAGIPPTVALVDALDAAYHEQFLDHSPQETVYPTGDPGPDVADTGDDVPVLRAAGEDLRRVLHRQLGDHLRAEGVPVHRLDFSHAEPRGGAVQSHDGEFCELDEVRGLNVAGEVVYAGPMCFVHDPLADGLWVFAGEQIPDSVWDLLDMGVRRRLVASPRWGSDPRVVAWSNRIT